jgi:hypothetical protein
MVPVIMPPTPTDPLSNGAGPGNSSGSSFPPHDPETAYAELLELLKYLFSDGTHPSPTGNNSAAIMFSSLLHAQLNATTTPQPQDQSQPTPSPGTLLRRYRAADTTLPNANNAKSKRAQSEVESKRAMALSGQAEVEARSDVPLPVHELGLEQPPQGNNNSTLAPQGNDNPTNTPTSQGTPKRSQLWTPRTT